MNYVLNLREMTYSLSEALDFVGIDDTLHGKRVAYMAAEVAKALECPQEDIDRLIYVGMMHDCGVSSTLTHKHLVSELDWSNSNEHCVRGAELLKSVGVFYHFAPYVLYHHTHWEDLPSTLEEKQKTLSNLIYLVDRVDALNAQYTHKGGARFEEIRATIQKYSGVFFAKELVDAFLKVSAHESFWLYLEPEALDSYLHKWMHQCQKSVLDFDEVKSVAYMFASIVDAKSPFTSDHSKRVSALALELAKYCGLGQDQCEKVELAALLHDLGKLRISDEILNKTDSLTDEERGLMNRHSFDTSIILKRIEGFEEIADLAAFHHEKMDGLGYPYGLKSNEIPFAARIIVVADIFQALVQNRPYREGLNQEVVLKMIDKMCSEGKLDAYVVVKLKENLNQCYKIAQGAQHL